MGTSEPTSGVVRFGAFAVDASAGELRRNGVRIRLQEQPFQALAALLERPGEVVTREELRYRLWPQGTFVDFDHSLATAIAKVREALGDSADRPRYVETVPRHGYRFIAVIEPGGETNEAAEPGWQPSSAERPELAGETSRRDAPTAPSNPGGYLRAPTRTLGRAARVTPLAVAGVVAICLLLTFWPGGPPARVVSYQQITHDGRQKLGEGSLTTDGASVYFVEMAPAGWILASAPVGGGDTIPVATALHNLELWDSSPSGSELLVGTWEGSYLDHEKSLWRQPARGGSPRRVGNIMAHSATWSPDGREIAYSAGEGIFVAESDGSNFRRLASLTGIASGLSWSPDGGRIRFTLTDNSRNSGALWEVSTAGGNLHRVLPDWNDPPSEAGSNWTSDGRYFLFHSLRNGRLDVWASRERSGLLLSGTSAPAALTAGPIGFHSPLHSLDGKKVFVVGTDTRAEIRRYDAKSGDFAPYLTEVPASAVAFARDGGWVAYVPPTGSALWRSRTDGSDRLQLTFAPILTADAPCWSPDGTCIAFRATVKDKPWKIYIVTATGGLPQELLPGRTGEEGFPSWSPDGRAVAFGDVVEEANSAAGAIHIVDLKSRSISTVPGSQGLWTARWSPDGTHLAAITRDQKQLMLFDFATRTWSELARLHINDPRWSRDGKHIYFDVIDAEPAIYRLRRSDRKLEKVVSLGNTHDNWLGLDQEDSPLAARTVGTQEIYALDWQAP